MINAKNKVIRFISVELRTVVVTDIVAEAAKVTEASR